MIYYFQDEVTYMKKIFPALASVILVLSGLISCSTSSDDSSSLISTYYTALMQNTVTYDDYNLSKFFATYTSDEKSITVTYNSVSVDSTVYNYVYWFKSSEGNYLAACQSASTHISKGAMSSYSLSNCDFALTFSGYGKASYSAEALTQPVEYKKTYNKSDFTGTYTGRLTDKNGVTEDITVVISDSSAIFTGTTTGTNLGTCDKSTKWLCDKDNQVIFAVQTTNINEGVDVTESNYTSVSSAYFIFYESGYATLVIPTMTEILKENTKLTKN